MKVLGGVLILRGVTTAYVSTFKTQPQVYPSVPHLYAFFADVLVGGGDADLIQVRASRHEYLLVETANLLAFMALKS